MMPHDFPPMPPMPPGHHQMMSNNFPPPPPNMPPPGQPMPPSNLPPNMMNNMHNMSQMMPPNPSNPMQQGFALNQSFMQQQQQQQQQQPSIPFGPTQPPIFTGHIENHSTKKEIYLQELFFQQYVKIEGIHIVPEMITPPGFTFTGKTFPRQFELEIFGKVQNSSEWMKLFSSPIYGGVQWLPILETEEDKIFEDIVIKGDFEILSLIIHGTIIEEDSLLPSPSLPLPAYLYEYQLDSKEINILKQSELFLTSNSDVLKDHETLETIFGNITLLHHKNSLKSMFSSIHPEDFTTFQRNFVSLIYPYSSSSLVSLSIASNLIEKIFSLDSDPTQQPTNYEEYQQLIQQIHELIHEFQYTYEKQSFTSVQNMGKLMEVIGDEGAQLVANYTIKQLKNFIEQTWLHSQTTKPPTNQPNESTVSPIFDTIEKKTQFYLQYGESILALCHVLLKNDLLAEEFITLQGMYYLDQLTFHIQTLPISLSTLLIMCYSDAFVYSTAAKGFITMNEEIHTSPYQSMLYYVASIKSNSPSMIPCQWLFNLYAWYDDLTHLSSLVDVSIPILHDIVEGINSKLTSCEKIPSTVNEYDQDMEHNHQNTMNDEDILHIPSQVLEEVFQNLFQITNQIELSWNNVLQSYELFSSHSSTTSSLYQLSYIQYMTLKNTHFLSSLIALLSIRMITLELQTLLDWKAPNQMKIHTFLQQLDHILSLFFMKLFSIAHWELLVIDQPKILDIYWNTISTTSIGSIGAFSSKLSQYLLFDVRNLHIFPQYITTLNQSQPIDTYDPLFVTFTMIHYILQQIETFFQAISFDPVLVTSNAPESLKTIDEITTQIRQTGSSLLSLLQHPILRSMVQIFLIKYYLVDLIQHILQITKYLDNDSLINASSDIQSKLYQVGIKNLSTILHSCLLSPDATVLSIVHVHSQVLQEVIEHLSMIKKSSKTLSTVVKDISDILSSTALSTLISLPLQQQQNQGNALLCMDTYDSRQDEILLYPEWIETFQQFSFETFKSKEKLTKFNQRMNILSSYMISLSSASIELIYTHAYSIFQCAYETLVQLLIKCFLPNSEANVYLQYKLQKISSSSYSDTTLSTMNSTLIQEMKGFIEQQYTLKEFVPVIENIFTLLNTMFHCFSSPNSPIPMTKLSYEPILTEYFQLFMNFYSFAASPWLQSISKFTSFHIQQMRLFIRQIFQQFVLTTANNSTSSTTLSGEEKNEEQQLIFHLFETLLTRINDHYLFEKEMLLQLLIDILFPTLLQSETITEETTLSSFVTFLHQNTTMLTLFLNIIQHSLLHESIEFNDKIISLLLLITKYCMTNTPTTPSTPESTPLLLSIYDLLMNLFDKQSKEYLQTTTASSSTTSTTSTPSLEQEKTFQEQKLLKLLFIFSKLITSSPIATYFFVDHGIIELLFPFFQVDLTILLPSFQLILLIRTQLLYLLETTKEENEIIISNYSLKLTIDSMTAHLIDNIPRLPKKFPDSGILLAQSIIAIHGLSDASYWNKFLQTVSLVGEGFTLEFIAIKLWIYFEDSYQYLYEINDIRKQYALAMSSSASTSTSTSSGASASTFQPQDITSLLLEAQRQYHLATYALKCILDIAMWSYEAQKIPLSSLAKTMRSSLTDPRKLIIRIRGQYNIWFSSLSPELIIPTDIKYLSLPTNNSSSSNNNNSSSSEGDQRNMFFTSEQLELFDSRHAGISFYLRYLVELTSKFARYQSAKEERYKNFLPCQEIPMEQWTIALTQCNFNKPFDQSSENSLTASSSISSSSYLLIKTWANQHVSQLITSWIPSKQNLFLFDIISHCFYSQWSNEPSITRPMMYSSIILQNVEETPISTYKKQRVMDITIEPLPKTPVVQEKRSLPPPPPPPSFANSDDSRFKNPPPTRREEDYRFPPNEQFDNNSSNQGFNDPYRESPSKYNRRLRVPSDRGIHGLPKTAFQSNSYSDSQIYGDDNSHNYNQNNNMNQYVPNGNPNEYFDEFSNSSFSNPPSGPPRGFQNGPLPPNPPFFPPRGPPPPSGFARPPPPMPPQFRPQQ